MTKNYVLGQKRDGGLTRDGKRFTSPLSLRQRVPSDWHFDRPAFEGDPYMDWQSEPEPPKQTRWKLTETPTRA